MFAFARSVQPHLAMSLALLAAPALAEDGELIDARDLGRYEACLALAETDAAAAREEASAWRVEGGGVAAKHCDAASLIAIGEVEEGAARLEALAASLEEIAPAFQIQLLDQASTAWMTAGDGDRADAALSEALRVQPNDPDLLIGRALARGLEERFADAAQDLTFALAKRPGDLDALRLRAQAYLRLGLFTDAQGDINAVLRAKPDDIEALILQGDLREAEAGRPPALR